MSLQSKLYYWLRCDGCGDVSSEEWETWPHVEEAIRYAKDIGWYVGINEHYCQDCYEASN